MVPAVAAIELAFDPVARAGPVAVRWETLGIAGAVLTALLLAAWLARRTPIDREADAWTGILGPDRADHPRRDDLLFLVLGAVPGAVIGGRVGYAFLHPDWYAMHPDALLDPGQGSLELVGTVLGGVVTAALVAVLLEAPVSRWFHVAAAPLLVALGLGKGAQALGGSGQGALLDAPWATSYAGAGPWGSLGADLPAHPAQLYEAAVALVALLVLAALALAGAFHRRDGRAFAVAFGLWAMGRAAVSLTWRDDPVLGVANAGTVLAGFAVAVALLAFALAPRLTREPRRKSLDTDPEPAWPDPATRPRF